MEVGLGGGVYRAVWQRACFLLPPSPTFSINTTFFFLVLLLESNVEFIL